MQYLYKNDKLKIEELTAKITLNHEFSKLAALKKMIQVIHRIKVDVENSLLENAMEHRDLSLLKLRF